LGLGLGFVSTILPRFYFFLLLVANIVISSRGKVFVYTGILPICKDEDGLAAVLGHEIAHIVAHHPAERMSNSFITLGAVFALSFLFDVSGQLSSMLLNLMYSLPNSRTQEVRSDILPMLYTVYEVLIDELS
jgi:Zn-dependent protease with chaperone function